MVSANRTICCNAHAQRYDLKISWWMGSSNGFSVWHCTFWRKSKRITIPDQSYYNLPEKKLWRISKNRVIVTLFCCVLQQTWRQLGPGVWCLFVNISGHGQCGRKRKKTSRILRNRKRIFKQIVWTGMFSYQTNSHHKNFHLANIRPLVYTILVPWSWTSAVDNLSRITITC